MTMLPDQSNFPLACEPLGYDAWMRYGGYRARLALIGQSLDKARVASARLVPRPDHALVAALYGAEGKVMEAYVLAGGVPGPWPGVSDAS